MKTSYVYAIFRLDRKYYTRIRKDLKSRGYSHIRPFIPTVSILKKSRKGKNEYEDVPLLFNYGFLKMPTALAFDRYFLNRLKKNIPGILSFVRSLDHPPKRKRLRVDNAEDYDDFSRVSTISKADVLRYKEISKQNKIYSAKDIAKLQIGDYIVLKGYPFEGIPATILDSNLTTRRILVKLYPGSLTSSLDVEVAMDNVLYSAYHDSDENKFYSTGFEPDLSRIPDGSTEELLFNNQY